MNWNHLLDRHVVIFRQVGFALNCQQQVDLPLRLGFGGEFSSRDLHEAASVDLVDLHVAVHVKKVEEIN